MLTGTIAISGIPPFSGFSVRTKYLPTRMSIAKCFGFGYDGIHAYRVLYVPPYLPDVLG